MSKGLGEKKIGLLEKLSSKNQAYHFVIPLVRKKYQKLFDNARGKSVISQGGWTLVFKHSF